MKNEQSVIDVDRVAKGEAAFAIHELFFSRTDRKGHILSFNDIFVRVSQFSREEMFMKPHNLVRHRDMPRAVFKLLWSYLLSDRSIIAYVKNRSKEGLYYWVLALAMPLPGGEFLSIRLKPSSSFFTAVQGLYTEMLLLEEQDKGDTERSTAYLLEKITELGFDGYDSFSKQVLSEELKSRDQKILAKKITEDMRGIPFEFEGLQKMVKQIYSTMGDAETGYQSINSNVAHVEEICQQVVYLTRNMEIASAHLGESGLALEKISSNFSMLVTEIETQIKIVRSALDDFSVKLRSAIFAMSFVRLQVEMMCSFFKDKEKIESFEGQQRKELEKIFYQDMAALKFLNESGFDQAGRILQDFLISFGKSNDAVVRLFRVVMGMEIIRISGRIEVSRLTEESRALEDHLDSMNKINVDLTGSLKAVTNTSQNLLKEIGDIVVKVEQSHRIIKGFNSNQFEQESAVAAL